MNPMPEPFLLDDFRGTPGISRLGTRWAAFTDGVMGGLSRMEAWLDELDGERCMRFAGDVRLENRGGFIQVALPLVVDGHAFDARHFRAIALRVRGSGAGFQAHLRTTATGRPWQYFKATFEAGEAWTTLELPLSRFQARPTPMAFDPGALTRLGIVAYGHAGRADLAVSLVGLVG
jgi:hypothetical protein